MLRLPPFTFHRPDTVADAVRIAADHGPRAMFVAGGTDLYPNMKRRHQQPREVISLAGLQELRGVRGDPAGGMTVGAMTTLTGIERHPVLREAHPALVHAVREISTPLLRNMGTLGGNLLLDTRCTYYDQTHEWRESISFCMKEAGEICWVAPSSPRCWAVSSSDTAPVFIALEAECTLVGPEGERRVPVKSLYRHDGIDFLQKKRDEILTEIHVPKVNGTRATYLKLRRRDSIDFPILGVAAALDTAQDGTIQKARIVLTAVESAPVEADKAEAVLLGKKLDDDVIEEAASVAYRPARPLDNTDLTHAYRKKMARVYVARALRELMRAAS